MPPNASVPPPPQQRPQHPLSPRPLLRALSWQGLLRSRALRAAALLLLVAGALFVALRATAAISVGTSSGTFGANSQFTLSHTVASGTDRLLIVAVAQQNPSANHVTSVTYGGVALAKIAPSWDNNSNNEVSLWLLAGPAVGTANVVAQIRDSGGTLRSEKAVVRAVNFTGVDQSDPIRISTGDMGISNSITVTVPSVTNDVVFSVVATTGDADAITPTVGTELWEQTTGTGGSDVRSEGAWAPGAASVTMTWTTAASKNYTVQAVSLRPSGAGIASAAGIAIGSLTAPAPVIAASLTFSHTVPTGDNRALVVTTGHEDTARTVNSVTYGGVALTKAADQTSTNTRATLWYLLNPAVGTANVVVTISATENLAAMALNLSGVHQTTPIGTAVGATGQSLTPSATVVSASGEWVVGALATGGDANNASANVGQTSLYNTTTGTGGSNVRFVTDVKPGAASTNIGWTLESSKQWAAVAVPFKPAPAYTISGTVFEDINYGGGAGRSRAAAAGVGIAGATVELYDSTGSLVSATTTAAGGSYSFSVNGQSTYYVRVVVGSVLSTRTGSSASLMGVQTFRTNASSGTPVAVTNAVGGTNPSAGSAPAAGTGGTFDTSTFVYNAGISGTAQSVTTVTVASANISGLDVGFNFDTVVNTLDSGYGSLRQAITNANALTGDSSLAVAGRSAGIEHILFNIATTATGFTGTVGTNGRASIALASNLPTITAPLVVDGSTQTSNVSDSNPGLVGAGGTVGADALVLSQVSRPEVELIGSASTTAGLTLAAANVTVRGLAIYGVRGALGSGIVVNSGTSNALIEGNLIGVNAQGADPGAALRSLYGVVANGGSGVTVQNNFIAYTDTAALATLSGLSTSWTVQNNEVREIGLADVQADGINLIASTGWTVRGNLIVNVSTQALLLSNQAGSAELVINNTITGGGRGSASLAPAQYDAVAAPSGATSARFEANIVTGNYGAGIAVNNGASGVAITRNLIYGNGSVTSRTGQAASGSIDIDLLNTTDNNQVGTAPFFTSNDAGDADSGGNGLQNHPVLTRATVLSGQVEIQGTLNSNANGYYRIEFFSSSSPHSTGRGGGQVYLGFVNVATDGSGNASFTATLNVSVAPGTSISATAIKSNVGYAVMSDTSEYAPNVLATLRISGTVFEDPNYGGGAGRSLAGAGGVGLNGARVELYSGTGAFISFTTTAGGGAYNFDGLSSNTGYHVRVVSSTVASQRSGSVGSLLGVMTYRAATTGAAGSLSDVTDWVGGTNPASANPGNGAGGTSFNTTTYVFTAGLAGTAHAVSPVTSASVSLAGVNLGFNFSTVVNTNDSGPGSLRQALTNADTLGGDTSLAVAGRSAAVEHVVFMISNGSSAAGLRNTLNYFSAGIATIAPTTALPTLSNPLVIDAQLQPGWVAAPIVELNGAAAGAAVTGLTLNGAGSTVRGLVVNRFLGNGISTASATGLVIEGNYIGTNSAGSAASANALNGILIAGGSATIGGLTSSTRNVISGNTQNGVSISGGSATVRGNFIGSNAAASGAIGNGAAGVLVASSGSTIGGTAAGTGNVIRGNGARGVAVANGAFTGNAVLGNSIYGNSSLGIDLKADGLTAANDGAKTAGASNLAMDSPVFTSAVISGTNLTVAGYVGSAASQSAFATARVEVFVADASSSAGQGQTYLGALTTDASGNFSGTLAGVTGVANGSTQITGTATDTSNNTSEFGANAMLGVGLSGTVFEDVNYGGGAGRNLAASSGSGVSGATVELYNSSGIYVSSTATGTGGGYSFPGLIPGSYHVRVVSSTVASQRSGSTGTLASVLSYRTTASSGAAVAVTDHVGGTNPALVDPGTASSGAAFNTSTFVYTAGPSGTAQNLTPVTTANINIGGLDFGFNFNTVVNTNDSGPGSLRQAITNANTLAGDASLAQSGRSAAIEHLVFMISNGTTGSGGSLGLSGGLRTSINLHSAGVATITPASALPALSTPMVMDAQAQPGWTANPLLSINGTSAGAGSHGLTLTGGNALLRGLQMRGYASGHGIFINGSGANTIQGCWVGLNVLGTAAAANAQGIWIANSANNVVGGNTSNQRNAISGNTANGLVLSSATGTVVKGNYFGLAATGTAAVANGDSGIVLLGNSTGTLIGGTAAGEANFIAGNNGTAGGAAAGVSIQSATATGSVIQGNVLGLNASQSAAIASVGFGIYSVAANTTIGGTTAGMGNVITAYSLDGIAVAGASATGVSIQRNSIYGNTGIGIDLADNGATANDGAKTAGQGNQLMDHPVFTSATLSGTTLTLTGYVGSAASQSTFATSRVEVFVSDASSAFGQGQTYLGFVTADASGNFSASITGVTGVTIGSSAITGTATDGSGNTSEFGANATIGWGITGTVFEDVNYGGGAGRSQATASGVGLVGATVELYSSTGVWMRATTTAAGGAYSFQGLVAVTYHVRVVGASVLSQRAGSSGALVGVMTYRTTAASGAAVAVTDQVGGTTPALVDPGVGSAGATFNTVTGVYSAVLSGTAQSFAPVVVSTAIVAGVDFGFNFDTVVNTNSGGQGSLRQAITNANAFSDDATLAVAGRSAATEHTIFMLADGTARPGLRNTFASQFAAGIAAITPTSALPSVTGTLVLDAQTQPGWVQDPIVELRGNAAGAVAGLTLAGGASTVRGLIINRYGSHGISVSGGAAHTVQGCWVGTDATGAAAAANSGSGISVSTTAVGLQIGGTTAVQRNVVSGNSSDGLSIFGGSLIVVQGNYVGTNAAGTAAVANAGIGVYLNTSVTSATLGGTAAGAGNVISGNTNHGAWLSGAATTVQGNTVGLNAAGTAAVANGWGLRLNSSGHVIGGTSSAARNVISGNTNQGIWISAGGNTVQGNYVGSNAAGTLARPNSDGIYVAAINNTVGGSAAGAGNLVSGNSAAGVLLTGAANGTTVQGNVVGRNATGTATLPNGMGISVQCSSGCSIGGTANNEGNTINGNAGTGVSVSAASQGNAILGNSIYGNGGIGIDLNANGVTTNDAAKTGGAGNLLMDHPVFTSARARGNQLTVAGYVGTAAGQSLFANARVEIFASDQDASGFGEGQTFLGFVTTDASGNFSATLTMTQSVLAVATRLTGTATDGSNNSSEFGANFTGLVVDLVVNHNGDAVDANPGDGICQTATPNQCTLRAALMEVNALAVQPSALTIAFALPGCSTGTEAACVITPPTNLPSATKAVAVDGSTQPGYATRPLVALVGPGSGTPTALEFGAGAGGSTARALRFAGWTSGTGTTLNLSGSNGHTVQGNWFGLDGSGVASAGATNRSGVTVQAGSSNNLIGGTTTAQRNVVAGSAAWGVYLLTGSANQVLGNWFGLNADGGTNAQSPNNVGVQVRSTGALLGGVLAGEGNRFGPATLHHIAVDTNAGAVPMSSATIRGNLIGFNGAGAAVASGSDGIFIDAGVSSTTIGGTTAAAANSITGSSGRAIGIAAGSSTRATVQGNSIYGNTGLGIDLGRNGVTANDGATNATQANNGIDHPVFTGAGVAGDGLGVTVLGYVGTGSGQAAFAGARVELFKAAPDASGYGQGQVYLGFLTADANGRFSGTVAITFGSLVVGDTVTATASDAAGNSSEFGPNRTSTTMAALAPAAFNAFETDTGAGALSGVIRSKVAGTAATLAFLALDWAGSAPHAGFTGSVQLNWLDARDDSGAIIDAPSGSCRASWVDLGAAGTASFSNNNRINVAVTAPATATKAMRLKMTYAGPDGTVVACSNDAFAALPAQLAWVGASDADSATAGTVRTLNNVAASGGVVHQAGRPFTLRAQALTSGGVLMTAYDGSPALAISSCVLPAGCTAGTLGGGAATAAAGVYTHSTVTYSEVGAVAVQLTDTAYGNVDIADTAAALRTLTSSALSVGRFVPDSYGVAVSTSGVLATANASCLAAGSGATFLGQGFGWATTPQVTVTARNAAGATTLLWTGSLMKLAPGAGLAPALSVASAGTASLAASYAAATVLDLGSGQARLQAGALDRFVLDTAGSTPQASTTPSWQWQLAITDSSEAGSAGNPQPGATATQGSVLFNQGSAVHSGRLALASAHGDARSGVRMLMQLQRYTAAGWVTMTEDRGCVTVQRGQLEVGTPSGVFVGNLCAAALTANATTAGGRAWLALPATPAAASGRLALRVAGTAASGSACSPVPAVQPVASLGLPWLTGGAAGGGPLATATWGRTQRDMVMRREVW